MRALSFLFVAALVAACKHDDGMPTGTATIHSGTPEGPRVTNLPLAGGRAPATGMRAEVGDKLARAHCRHERECALGEGKIGLMREETCFAESRHGMRASLDQWPCDPGSVGTGIDSCLAAIHDASCSARVGEGAQIPACSAAEICRRGNVAGR